MNNTYKMDGDQKMILGITIAIVTGIVTLFLGIAIAVNISNIEGNTIRIACFESDQSWINGECVPQDAVLPSQPDLNN